MRFRLPLHCLLALACMCAAASARQDETQGTVPGAAQDAARTAKPVQRSRLIGRTVLQDGAVWANCEIRFFSRPLPDRVDLGQADVVEVKSSDKGRFHARLLPGRRYMAWAWTIDEKGRHWFGQMVDRVAGGQVVKFVRGKTWRAPEKLIIKGREDWKSLGPLSFHVRFGPQGYEIPLAAPDETGQLIVPPLPCDKALILAKTPDLEPLHVYEFQKSTLPLLAKVWKFEKAHPLELEILAADAPVAGARVSALVYKPNRHASSDEPGEAPSVFSIVEEDPPGLWAQLGKSDAQGHCDLIAHKQIGGYGKLTLRIQAEGMADLIHVLQTFPRPKVIAKPKAAQPAAAPKGPDKKAPSATPKATPEVGDGRLRITLEKGVRVHGRILLAGGEPAADLPFVIQRKISQKGRHHSRIRVRSLIHRTKADGTFSFSVLGAKTLYRIVVAMDEGVWNRLSPAWPELRMPSPYVLVHQARSTSETTQDLGDLALDKLVAVDLTLASARRDRDARAIAILKNVSEQASIISEAASVLNFDFDARGRACFLVPPGTYDSLILHSTRGSDQEPFALEDRDRGRIFKRQIKLTPFRTILITVKDANGKPVPGASLSMGGGGYTHLSKLCTEIYGYNGRAIRSVLTDETGKARLELLDVKSQNYTCSAQSRKNRGTRGNQVRIDTNSLPETLEFEVGN